MAILSVREGIDFESEIKSDTASVAAQVKLLLDQYGHDIKFIRDPTRGGVATVLNEAAQQSRLCITLQEDALPVLDPVQNLCEILGLDPLYVANEGIFIAVVSASIAEECTALLSEHSTAEMPRIIGKVEEIPAKCVMMTSSLGGKRVVHMPVGEQLPRIC